MTTELSQKKKKSEAQHKSRITSHENNLPKNGYLKNKNTYVNIEKISGPPFSKLATKIES
jgi:hypothetical protein